MAKDLNVSNQKNSQSFQRSRMQRASYGVMRHVLRTVAVFGWGVRCFGRENLPSQGGALICANHQSNLDPPMIGILSNRRMNYLAKKTLFNHQPFKWFIEHLDAIPIDREGIGIGGIKETIRRLRRGEQVLIFPEGQRTFDGELSPFMPGFCALATRTKVPLVPIGFDGAFQSLPRGAKLPFPSRLWMVVGQPVTYEEYCDMSNQELMQLMEQRIRDCFLRARAYRENGHRELGQHELNQTAERDSSAKPN